MGTPSLHLDPSYVVDGVCEAAMDDLTWTLLESVEVTSGGGGLRHRPKSDADLKNISAMSLDTSLSLKRPALLRITEPGSGANWMLPAEDDDRWSGTGWCLSSVGASAVEIGAWSSGADGFSDANESCSLPLLEPYDLLVDLGAETVCDAGDMATDADETMDSGVAPHVDAPVGLADAVSYGLSAGCRYSAAAVVLLLPLGIWRRRSDASTGGKPDADEAG